MDLASVAGSVSAVCTVIIDGAAVRSCLTPVSAVRGEVTTLEGQAKDGKLHPPQQVWIDEQAVRNQRTPFLSSRAMAPLRSRLAMRCWPQRN